MAGLGQITFPEQYNADQMSGMYQQLQRLINTQNSTILSLQNEVSELKQKVANLESA